MNGCLVVQPVPLVSMKTAIPPGACACQVRTHVSLVVLGIKRATEIPFRSRTKVKSLNIGEVQIVNTESHLGRLKWTTC